MGPDAAAHPTTSGPLRSDQNSRPSELLPRVTRDEFVRVYRIDHKEYSDFLAEVIDILVRDETSICFRGRVGGTQQGPMVTPNRSYPPSGKPYKAEFLCWVQTTGGLIRKIVFGFNFLTIWTQLGHMDAP